MVIPPSACPVSLHPFFSSQTDASWPPTRPLARQEPVAFQALLLHHLPLLGTHVKGPSLDHEMPPCLFLAAEWEGDSPDPYLCFWYRRCSIIASRFPVGRRMLSLMELRGQAWERTESNSRNHRNGGRRVSSQPSHREGKGRKPSPPAPTLVS